MNKGTKEGSVEEVLCTQNLNKKTDIALWKIFGLDPDTHWAVHVNYHKMGKINEKKIWTKADVYIAKGVVDKEYIRNNDFYLNEDDAKKFNLIPVPNSGISIKRCDSKKYQIMKMGSVVFTKLFGSNLLAAGASIYNKNSDEFVKNKSVLKGWGVSESDFKSFFCGKINEPSIQLNNEKQLMKIKKISNKEIEDMINKSKTISDFIFLGKGNFIEPYTASWFLENNNLRKATSIPFTITTGSGRSKGVYTIVVKPR